MQRIPTSASDTVKPESFAFSLFIDYLGLPEIANAPLIFLQASRSVFDTAEQQLFDS